ncbi:NnrU family protein [Rhodoferax saidenbachensis]|uniref:Protein NrnU n=1 Tax=Rhodoferax saidenbachensis TaxID=1484693 RepID=A0A1P8K511_9BURK|nr:NnrU family protein [Rhodoferax saidenbachensis]APW41104.1 protein NrnU [Rhodoferax saidenbachensis]
MTTLVLGLLIFLGVHSVRIVADGWRTRTLAGSGKRLYHAVHGLLSLLGFGLVVWGFGMAREAPIQLWVPPVGMRHLAALLTLLAFVLLAAACVPGNSIKARFHHPLLLGIKTWALAHLMANGNVAHVLLFGSFLAWAAASFIAARRRDRAQGTQYPAGTVRGTLLTVLAGGVAWAVFAFWLHGLLIGIRPLG